MFRWIGKNIGTFLLALILATVVWIAAVNDSDPDEEDNYPTPLKVEIVGQDSSLLITNDYSEQIRLKLRAPRSIWSQLEEDKGSIRVILDLAGLEAGEYSLTPQIQVGIQPSRIISFSPSKIDIILEELITKNFEIELESKIETSVGYRAGTPRISVKEVEISGAKSFVENVNRVRVSYEESDIREDVEESLKIDALDANGKAVQGINLSVETLQLYIPVSQQGGYKDVAVKIIVTGQVAELYRLRNISVFPPVITLYSDDTELIDNLYGIVETESLDINGINEDISARLKLNLPENTAIVGDQSVLVEVSVEPILGSLTISEKPLEIINLDPTLTAELSLLTVDIIVSGPLPVLETLNAEDLRVVVDVDGLTIGAHQLTPVVEIINGEIKVESVLPESVELSLIKTPLATPTAKP